MCASSCYVLCGCLLGSHASIEVILFVGDADVLAYTAAIAVLTPLVGLIWFRDAWAIFAYVGSRSGLDVI